MKALEKYLSEKIRKKAIEKMQKLPKLSLGSKPLTREEIYGVNIK